MEKVNVFTKKEQEDLAWRWHLDPSLQFAYGSFDKYIKSKELERLRENK